MSGYTMTQTELLYSQPVPVTKNNFTTQALISAVAATAPVAKIPAGYFQENPNPIGRSLYMQAFGSIGVTTGSPTFSPVVGLDTIPGTLANATTIYSATTPSASAVIAQFQFQLWLTCTAFGESAGMTLQLNGQWSQSTVATGGAGNASGISSQCAASITGLTPANAYYVELFGTWGTASASNGTVIQQMFLFGLN